jgi:hypothetical protein
MSKWRVATGASIVGVIGAAALSTFLIGPQVGQGSGAEPVPTRPAATATTDPPDTEPLVTEPPVTNPPATEPPRASTTAAVTTTSTSTTVAPAPVGLTFANPATCPATGHAAVVDREHQRAWLCGDGEVTREVPITSAWSQPDPGDYQVYAKDLHASSTLSGRYSTMTHFVAFTHGKFRGARIAFHSVPTYSDGSFVQPLESVGAAERRGESAGCLRVLPADAEQIWAWLEVGDVVRVVS